MARPVSTRVCTIEGCGLKHQGNGFCRVHYKRWYRYGDPLVQKQATPNRGKDPLARRAHVIQHKLNSGCVDCGYNDHHAALDFDHRPGTIKVRDIKSGQQLGWVALLAEIAKCDVVCANCHRIRTYQRQWASTEGGDVT